ncbi:MAG: DUF1269 domain-containing protein [Thermoleophilia bacterium]
MIGSDDFVWFAEQGLRDGVDEMGSAVPPGKAGWFLLIDTMTEDKFLDAVQGIKATVVRTNLSNEDERELKEAFGADRD